jgi:arsenite methyltransferase
VVARGEVPAEVRRHVELWSGCIAGALEESDYRAKLQAAGFEAIDVEPTRIYSAAQCSEWFAQAGLEEKLAPQIDGMFMSAFVRARKPA